MEGAGGDGGSGITRCRALQLEQLNTPHPPPSHTHTHTHTPLQVGGPAGTMEGGRQSEVARAILQAKDIPYTIAAPLLIQVRLRRV